MIHYSKIIYDKYVNELYFDYAQTTATYKTTL